MRGTAHSRSVRSLGERRPLRFALRRCCGVHTGRSFENQTACNKVTRSHPSDSKNFPDWLSRYCVARGLVGMSAYRIYELTPADHVAASPTVVDCPDDAAAIEKARQRLNQRIIEVWRVDRCVIRMQPTVARR